MSESRKFYNKGVKNFHNGNLEKAIANLDVAISHDMKNSAALNLRGIIYYMRGKSEKALASWQINVDFNGDDIAMGHIESFETDKLNHHKYNKALLLIKNNKFLEAIDELEAATCTEYNTINVRNALAYCYIKERDYDKAKENINIVLEKDRNNEPVKENIDIIKKESGISIGGYNKKYIAVAAFVIIVLAGGLTMMDNAKKIPNGNDNTAGIVVDRLGTKDSQEKENEADSKEETTLEGNKTTLDVKKLKDSVESKDFEWIQKNLLNAEIKGLSELELEVIDDAKELMIAQGVQYFYKQGTNEFNAKNFGKAKEVFLKALSYSDGTYLDAHITYMLSVTCETLGDNKDAIKYYEKYESTDYEEEGSYREEVLYKLAILNEKEGNKVSKDFARKLISEYPSSIYNNDNIKAILK
ncbi:MAG: tetratricopeptide repeat protein [Sarcina sp.]